MYFFNFIRLQLIIILSFYFYCATAYARKDTKKCRPGYYSGQNCKNNNYNICINNSHTKINEANNILSNLKSEKIETPSKINSCMKEVVASFKIESDKKSSLVRTQTKINDFKNNIFQTGRIQKMQEDYFNAIGLEANKLNSALPEIALRLNDLILHQNTKIDLIIINLITQMDLVKDENEIDKIEMEIEVFKKLRIIQSKISSGDPIAFNSLIQDALYGQGDRKLKAISAFDPLTYLVLKTVLDNKLTTLGAVGLNDLQDQMTFIKNDMRNFITKQTESFWIVDQWT